MANVLLVDDDDDFLLLGKRALARGGFDVTTAMSGQEALQRIDDEEWDIVLLDGRLPGLDGFDVLARIRTRYSLTELPVIMVTGLSDKAHVVRALASGANDYLTKPIDAAVANARINMHLTLKRMARQNEEFFSIASHDLKKPLALILDVIDTLQESEADRPDVPEDWVEGMDLVQRSARQMQQLVTDFLELRAVEHGEIRLRMEPVQVEELMHRTMEHNRAYARSKQIDLHLETDSVEVMTDPARVGEVLENLVGNAIKFAPPHTKIQLRARNEGDDLLLEVQDQGPGFAPELLGEVFSRRVDLGNRPTGGEDSTGMGLPICKRLVDLMGGDISAHNNPDRGACFRVRLPAERTSGGTVIQLR